MKLISTVLALVVMIGTLGFSAGCISIKAPEKVEVKSGDEQSNAKQVPYGGSKEEWKKFGKSFANAE